MSVFANGGGALLLPQSTTLCFSGFKLCTTNARNLRVTVSLCPIYSTLQCYASEDNVSVSVGRRLLFGLARGASATSK